MRDIVVKIAELVGTVAEEEAARSQRAQPVRE